MPRRVPSRLHRAPSTRLLAAVLLCAGLAGTVGAQPRMVVGRTEVDLGEMVKGEVREAHFRIANEGSEVLRIVRVKPG